MVAQDNSLAYTMPFQLTKKINRDVYDYLSPENKENQQNGKIILVTGGGSGIGAVCHALEPHLSVVLTDLIKGRCSCVGSCAGRRRRYHWPSSG